jgi:hypothetical protein
VSPALVRASDGTRGRADTAAFNALLRTPHGTAVPRVFASPQRLMITEDSGLAEDSGRI